MEILEISAKLTATMRSLGVDKDGLAARLYAPDLVGLKPTSPEYAKLTSERGHMAENIGNWIINNTGRSSYLLNVFNRIGREIRYGIDKGFVLLEMSLNQYKDILGAYEQSTSPARQAALSGSSPLSDSSDVTPHLVESAIPPGLSRPVGIRLHDLLVDVEAHYDEAHREKQFDLGQLDQKFIYLDYESVDHWRALISSRLYKTYWNCCDTLEELVQSPEWAELRANLGAIFVLGAGAPDKDHVILNSVSDLHGLNYVLIDTSLPMLSHTLKGLAEWARHLSRPSKASITPVLGDFLHLPVFLKERRLRDSHKRAGFIIAGGTICNIDEREFLNTVSQVANTDDFLVIGAEFIDEANRDEYVERLKATYLDEHVRDLALTPIRNILDQRRISRDRVVRRALIDVELVDPGWQYTAVPGALVLVVRVNVNGHVVRLAPIKRYNKQAFISYVENFGFRWVPTKTSGLRDSAISKESGDTKHLYEQLVFTKTAKDVSPRHT